MPVTAKAEGKMNIAGICGTDDGWKSAEKMLEILPQNKLPLYRMEQAIPYYYDCIKRKTTHEDIDKILDSAFSKSDDGDINYLYINAHGYSGTEEEGKVKYSETGIILDVDSGEERGVYKYRDLAQKLVGYRGKFVIIHDCCFGENFYKIGLSQYPNDIGRFTFFFSAEDNSMTNGAFGYSFYSLDMANGLSYSMIGGNQCPADKNSNGFISIGELDEFMDWQLSNIPEFNFGVYGTDMNAPIFQFGYVELKEEAIELNLTDHKTYEIKPKKHKATNLQKVNWKSSDNDVVSVDTKGIITANKAGTAKITAYFADSNGNMCLGSEDSCTVTVKEQISYLGTPRLRDVLKSNSSLKVTWNKIENAQGYLVYRKINSGSWKRVKTTSSTYYEDKNVKVGYTYTYTVKAYRKVDGKNIYSSYDKKGKSGKLTTSINVSSPVAGTVVITWKQTTGASGYYIYRATSKNGKYSKIATVKEGNILKYTNTGLRGGRNYYYKVTPYGTVNGKNIIGSSSEAKGVTVTEPSRVSLNKSSLSLYVGKTYQLKASVIGKSKRVMWKSLNASVATVSTSGKVTAKRTGTVTITATANSVVAKCKVMVKQTYEISNAFGKNIHDAAKILNFERFISQQNTGVFYKSKELGDAYETSGLSCNDWKESLIKDKWSYLGNSEKYTLYGIKIGMNIKAAKTILPKYGYRYKKTIVGTGGYQWCYFERDNRTIRIDARNGGEICLLVVEKII